MLKLLRLSLIFALGLLNFECGLSQQQQQQQFQQPPQPPQQQFQQPPQQQFQQPSQQQPPQQQPPQQQPPQQQPPQQQFQQPPQQQPPQQQFQQPPQQQPPQQQPPQQQFQQPQQQQFQQPQQQQFQQPQQQQFQQPPQQQPPQQQFQQPPQQQFQQPAEGQINQHPQGQMLPDQQVRLQQHQIDEQMRAEMKRRHAQLQAQHARERHLVDSAGYRAPPPQHQAGISGGMPPGVPPPPPASPGVPSGERMPLRVPPVQHQPTGDKPLEPEFDVLPLGMAMDYRVWVEAGREDCYYQFVEAGAQFYVSFHALRGGDGLAGFAVRDPSGQLVHPYQLKKESEYETTQERAGYFSICIDNTFSKVSGKLVNIYITAFRYDEWDRHTDELAEYDVVAANFTDGLGMVDHKIQIARQYLSHSRSQAASDWALLLSNNWYVSMWSLCQCVVVALTGCLQVFFVRKLFDTSSGAGGVSKSRPRI